MKSPYDVVGWNGLRAPGEKVEAGFSHQPARRKNLDHRTIPVNRPVI